MIVGDWNAEPDELRRSGWPWSLGAKVVAPSNTFLTCTSGEGRLIDYCLAGRGAAALIVRCEAQACPWKPHLAVCFWFTKDRISQLH